MFSGIFWWRKALATWTTSVQLEWRKISSAAFESIRLPSRACFNIGCINPQKKTPPKERRKHPKRLMLEATFDEKIAVPRDSVFHDMHV